MKKIFITIFLLLCVVSIFFIKKRDIKTLDNLVTYSSSEADFVFEYPSDWEIKEEYLYQTSACQMDPDCKEGIYYILIENDSSKIAINMPQCTGDEFSDLSGNNWICLFGKNEESEKIYEKIKESFSINL